MLFVMDEGEAWGLLDIGRGATEDALGVAGEGTGFAFGVECADGVRRAVTVACEDSGAPMLSYTVAPAPALTRREVEDALGPVVYGQVEDSLGELPLLYVDTGEGRFCVYLSGGTRADVLRCIVGMLGRMVRLDRAEFARHYGLRE